MNKLFPDMPDLLPALEFFAWTFLRKDFGQARDQIYLCRWMSPRVAPCVYFVSGKDEDEEGDAADKSVAR